MCTGLNLINYKLGQRWDDILTYPGPIRLYSEPAHNSKRNKTIEIQPFNGFKNDYNLKNALKISNQTH